MRMPLTSSVEAILAGLAHDIRTPLTAIVACVELLASSHLGSRERRWVNAVKSEADHLAAITTLIIDAAKMRASHAVLRDQPFSPFAIAQAVGMALVARAESKAVKADVKIAHDLPAMVSGDAQCLRAALENLADNAVKFTPEGVVTFTVAAEKAPRGLSRLCFTFSDSGIGISASELKHLFRPFAQASPKVRKIYGGAGLGLSFVKRLARAMGGDLVVTSRKGSGSTLRLSVLVKPIETASTARRPVISEPGPHPSPILYAANNLQVRN